VALMFCQTNTMDAPVSEAPQGVGYLATRWGVVVICICKLDRATISDLSAVLHLHFTIPCPGQQWLFRSDSV
jgi:hypothetical protein